MRSATGTVRWIRAEHRQLDKFLLWISAWLERGPCDGARPWYGRLRSPTAMRFRV